VKNVDDVATLVTAAVEAAVKPLKDEVAASRATSDANAKRADDQTLRNVVGEKFSKAGGKAKALDYIIGQAQSVFKIEGGVVKALPNKFSAEKPGEPLGVEEWLSGLAKEHDFAFEGSAGSGAAPVKGGGGALRAGQTILRDPTPQQLGENAKDIKAGKVKVEYSK
jgi:hypothetical protein